jgi:hypothetical protein
MRILGLVFLFGLVLGPRQLRADEAVNKEAVIASARELGRALDLFQQVLVLDPGPNPPRGLSDNAGDATSALTDFRQQIKNGASRDDLYVAFDSVDRKVKGLLGLLPLYEKQNGGVRLAARRLQAADHDLYFTLTVGDDAPARKSQVIYRQTLALLGFTEDLQTTANWLYSNRDPLADWTGALKAVRQAVVGFQRLQDKKAGQDDLKQQLAQLEQAWGKVMDLYNAAGNDQYVLQNSVARVDQVLGRIASKYGVKRRPPLSDYYSNY